MLELENNIYRSRLTEDLDAKAANFISSLPEDAWIFYEDIWGTEVHNIMLAEQKIISQYELKMILRALEKIRKEAEEKNLTINSSEEDIHEYLEKRVIDEIEVSIGGKMHTG